MTTPTITPGTRVYFKGDTHNDPRTVVVTKVRDDWFWYLDGGRERCAPVQLLNCRPRCFVLAEGQVA